MMADTILLGSLISGLIIFLFYALIRGNRLSRKKVLFISGGTLILIIAVFFFTGYSKLSSDISRIIRNTIPKPPSEIYTVLFKKPLDGCLAIVNIKDQVVPKIDCCIWMEVKVCPTELKRIASLKRYETFVYSKSDSLSFLQTFGDRPEWWLPENLGESIIKLNFKFNSENQQSIFFASDSSHLFICDQAL